MKVECLGVVFSTHETSKLNLVLGPISGTVSALTLTERKDKLSHGAYTPAA